MTSSRPSLEHVKSRLTRLLPSASAFGATLFRSSTPRYSNESDLLTGEGSRRNGGRWNPIGIGVVYASLTPETAMAETLAHYRHYKIPVEDAMPRTFVALQVRLYAVLDSQLGSVRQRLGVSFDRILTVDWRSEVLAGREPITQTLGWASSGIGREALVVPSAADPQGHNLLVFPPNLRPGSKIRVMHPDRLIA